MQSCCEIGIVVAERQRRMLLVVLWVNAAMFVAELAAGLTAHSTALLSDSADMLGDALVYGFSLYAVLRGPAWQARAALLKGALMGAFALGVLAEIAVKLARGAVPAADVMAGVGLVALAANLACLAMLSRHRGDDINMRSAWLCSRNDVIANVGVLAAAAGVRLTGAAWPDIATGLLIAAIFGASAVAVVRAAVRQLRTAPSAGTRSPA